MILKTKDSISKKACLVRKITKHAFDCFKCIIGFSLFINLQIQFFFLHLTVFNFNKIF